MRGRQGRSGWLAHRRTLAATSISLVALGLVAGMGAAVGRPSTDGVIAGTVPSVPAAVESGPAPAIAPSPPENPVRGPISYGLAEPAGALPGVDTPSDQAAWSRIRADVVQSGGCWLRSDLNTWLAAAIDALPWLGAPGACGQAGTSVKVLAILDDQTVWDGHRLCPRVAFTSGYLAHHADFTPDDWRALVRCLARRYAGRVAAYEIWNEPVLPKSEFGFEDGSPEHYLALLRIAYEEIKAADPATTVIALGGSDVYAGGDPLRLFRMHSLSSRLVALGAARYADAVSLHAYPWGRDDGAVWASYETEIEYQRRTWDKPVWITETGQRASDGGSQSAYAGTAYALFIELGIRHIFWFSITDQPDGDFGVRGRSVEAALRAFALAHP